MVSPGFDRGEIYDLGVEKNKIASKPEKYEVEVNEA